MYVTAHVGHLGNDVQRVVAHVLRVACGEAHAHSRRRLSHSPQQLGEGDDVSVVLEAV